MERLLKVSDISERYGCSMKTARKYLRQMFHYENPLAAPRWALDEWEKNREAIPNGISRGREKVILLRRSTGRTIVPRKR